MQGSLDERVGLVFRRLSLIRVELGEAALDRTLRDVLQALGAAAHREAEDRAGILAARNAAKGVRQATPIAQRRIDDGIHEGVEG